MFCLRVKNQSQLVRSSTTCRIDTFYTATVFPTLLGHCTATALRIRAIVSRLGSHFAFDDRSSYCRQSTPITFRCSRSTKIVLLSASLDSSGILFVLATVGLVIRTFGLLPSPRSAPFCFRFFFVRGTDARFRSDGRRTERDGNVTVFLVTPTV